MVDDQERDELQVGGMGYFELESGESELYAVAKGVAEGFSMKILMTRRLRRRLHGEQRVEQV